MQKHLALFRPTPILYTMGIDSMKAQSDIQIREFVQADTERLVEIALAAWAPVFRSFEEILGPELFFLTYPDWSEEKTHQIREACQPDSHGVILVAIAGETIAGFVSFYPDAPQHWADHGFGDWGIEETASGALVGFSGPHYIEAMSEVNLGYAFRRSSWRQGYGTEVCEKIIEIGLSALGLSAIVAVISPENTSSMRLAEKVGMTYWKRTTWSGQPRIVYRIGESSD